MTVSICRCSSLATTRRRFACELSEFVHARAQDRAVEIHHLDQNF